MSTEAAIDDYINLLGCDTARISRPLNLQFLIIGWRRHTKYDKCSRWFRDGEPWDFDYIAEQCIASGATDDELWASAKEYKRLCGLQMVDFLAESIKS